MIKSIKNELIITKSFFIITIVSILSAFIIGEAIGTFVIMYSLDTEYLSIGIIFSLITSVLLLTVSSSTNLYIHFDFALKMSISRKNYLIGSIGSMCINYLGIFIFLVLLNFIDKIYANWIFKNPFYIFEWDTYIRLSNMLFASVVMLSLSMIFAALVHKFGMIALSILILLAITIVLLLQILDSRVISDIFNSVTNMPISFIISIAVLFFLALFAVSIAIFMREPAKS